MNLNRSYEIKARPSALGGGWKLTLYENGQEAGGGVFPVPEGEPQKRLLDAFGQAQDQGEEWVGAR